MDEDWRPDAYARHGSFVPELGRPVLALLAPAPGERVLDLGCGDGQLSLELLRAGAQVVGVDASEQMVGRARERGIDARVRDARHLAFDAEFDAAFSNAALHWMSDLEAVFRGVRRALKPGGRFVAEMGGRGNIAAIVTACVAVLNARGVDGAAALPWRFVGPDEARALLEDAGFRVEQLEHFARPTPLPTDMEGWLETFAGPVFARLPEAERLDAGRAAVEALRPALEDHRGRWMADYVRLRFRARVPS